MLFGVRAFFNTNETHWPKYFFFVAFLLFASVQTSWYAQNAILNGLKQDTSNDCNVWDMRWQSDQASPTFLTVLIVPIMTWELWLSRINKCLFYKDMLPLHACIVVMKWKIHVENKHVIIHAHGCIAIVKPFSHHSM